MAGLQVSGVLRIAPAERAAILAAASRAYPLECCGLLEGMDEQAGWRVTGVHETANMSETPRRNFLVDPKAQFDLMRALRGSEVRLIGCFHSHPDGTDDPSESDRAQAFEADFLYLIAAGAPEGGFRLNAFRFDERSRSFVKLALAASTCLDHGPGRDV
jgi:proteasome lid subunit RPN8/RPN11